MRLLNINGKSVSKNVSKYLIDWDGISKSKLQFKVKLFLKNYWYKYICYEEFPVYGTRMKVDFLNASKKIAIEVHGRQHNEFNKHFQGNRSGFYFQIKRDADKMDWLGKNGIRLIEIYEEEIPKISEGFFLEKFGLRI